MSNYHKKHIKIGETWARFSFSEREHLILNVSDDGEYVFAEGLGWVKTWDIITMSAHS